MLPKRYDSSHGYLHSKSASLFGFVSLLEACEFEWRLRCVFG